MLNLFRNKSAKILLIIFISAMVVRLILPVIKETLYYKFPFIYYGDDLVKDKPYPGADKSVAPRFASDSVVYQLTAKSLIDGNGFAVDFNELKKYRDFPIYISGLSEKQEQMTSVHKHNTVAPMYPAFLSIFYYLFGINTLAYFLPQVVLSSLTCCLVYLIAKSVFNEVVAVSSAFMVALYPELIFWTNTIRVENLFIFLLMLCFWLLIKRESKHKPYWAIIIGAMLGITCLTRLTFLFFIPVILVWKYYLGGPDKRRTCIWLLALMTSFGLTVLPWAVRNHLVFNNFTIITDEAAATLADYSLSSRPLKELEPSAYRENRSYLLLISNFIMKNPAEFALKCYDRFVLYISPFPLEPIANENRLLAKIYKGLFWLIVFPAALFGMIAASKNDWGKSGLLSLFILYYIFFHSITFVDRGLVYRYPLLPFLCIFAAYTYWLVYNKINGKLIV